MGLALLYPEFVSFQGFWEELVGLSRVCNPSGHCSVEGEPGHGRGFGQRIFKVFSNPNQSVVMGFCDL